MPNFHKRFIVSYELATQSAQSRHILEYFSEDFPCYTMEEAHEGIANHVPAFSDAEWLNEVGKDFYPPDTDVLAQWSSAFEVMQQEVQENGVYVADDLLYRTYELVHTTESGEYYFTLLVDYYDTLNRWSYRYRVVLKPSLP